MSFDSHLAISPCVRTAEESCSPLCKANIHYRRIQKQRLCILAAGFPLTRCDREVGYLFKPGKRSTAGCTSLLPNISVVVRFLWAEIADPSCTLKAAGCALGSLYRSAWLPSEEERLCRCCSRTQAKLQTFFISLSTRVTSGIREQQSPTTMFQAAFTAISCNPPTSTKHYPIDSLATAISNPAARMPLP